MFNNIKINKAMKTTFILCSVIAVLIFSAFSIDKDKKKLKIQVQSTMDGANKEIDTIIFVDKNGRDTLIETILKDIDVDVRFDSDDKDRMINKKVIVRSSVMPRETSIEDFKEENDFYNKFNDLIGDKMNDADKEALFEELYELYNKSHHKSIVKIKTDSNENVIVIDELMNKLKHDKIFIQHINCSKDSLMKEAHRKLKHAHIHMKHHPFEEMSEEEFENMMKEIKKVEEKFKNFKFDEKDFEFEINEEEIEKIIENIEAEKEIIKQHFKMSTPEKSEIKKLKSVEKISKNDLELKQFSLFPNPNKGSFSMEVTSESESPIKVEVFNQSGKLIYSDEHANSNGIYKNLIELPGNQSGVFFVHVSQDNKSITRKVMVD